LCCSGAVKKWLFEKAYTTKKNNLVANGVFTHAIWDRLVFGKVAARLGGRVRLMITGTLSSLFSLEPLRPQPDLMLVGWLRMRP
jgi:hypothetical protein